jgi:glycosyltransferase involved in cell wall biosynthesis
VPAGDDAALALAIDRLLADEALRGRLGVSAHELMEREYSVTTMVERTLALYERVRSAKRR